MPDPGSTPPHARRGDWLAAAGLALAVALFYGRCATFAFTNWDDIPLLTDNPLTRTPGLETALALLRPGAVPQEHLYIPLTYLSHWLENALFGIQPAVVHSVNVFLHTLNAALVFGLGRRLGASRPAATLAALLFALHPLQVEAVAWGMGRKDLLATAFALAALLAWCRWRDDGRHRWYALGVGAWALSLLAKPATIVLPGVFVLLDLCRGRRVTACWRPQVPTLVIGVLVLVVNLGLGKEITGKVPLIERLAAIPPVIHGWVARLALAEAPSAFYPWPPPEFSLRLVSGCLVVAGLAAAITIAWRRRQPEWWLGLGFAALTFLPAIGIVISYRKFVTADRYGYLPFVGVALAVALSQKPAETQILAMAAYGAGAEVGFLLPYSRLHESEADHLGLIFMAIAGYDPHRAIQLWKDMEKLSHTPDALNFLSTHPTNAERVKAIEHFVPEAMRYYQGPKA